jgi:hypothetical protein
VRSVSVTGSCPIGEKVTRSLSARVARGWNFVIALLVAAGMVVQFWIAIRVSGTPKGHATGTLAGTPLANRVLRVSSFFTIESNLLSGITSAHLFRNPNRDGRIWRAVRLAALFGIAVTGIVYSTVLAKIHEPHGWKETSTNTAFHYIVPIMVVVGWLLFGPRPRIERRPRRRQRPRGRARPVRRDEHLLARRSPPTAARTHVTTQARRGPPCGRSRAASTAIGARGRAGARRSP